MLDIKCFNPQTQVWRQSCQTALRESALLSRKEIVAMMYENKGDRDPSAVERGAEGVYLNDLAAGSVVELDTSHHHYRLVKEADNHVRISGHPTFSPEPADVEVEGSIGNASPMMLKRRFIGKGMRMVLKHPVFNLITTSAIRAIHVT